MLSATEAEACILQLVQPLDSEEDAEIVPLLAACDRILAETVTSTLDFPHWDNSAMDGYAVRFADVKDCSDSQPAVLAVVEEIAAGVQPRRSLQPGEAARIFTGAMLPTGADTIVIQENTRREGSQVFILTAPEPHAFIRHQGDFYRAGSPLLQPGIRLQAPEIAVLAAAQCAQVKVYRRLRVALFSTGNELVAPDQSLQPGQIVDSNQYALTALLTQIGAEPLVLGIVPDEPEATRAAMVKAIAAADVVLSSGGVSVGDYDYVDRILAALGAEIHVRSVAVKPGKPLTVAIVPPTQNRNRRPVLYFGLPGNPASALVSFWRFVQPALARLSGLTLGWGPTFIWGRSRQDLRAGGQRETHLWGRIRIVAGHYEFKPAHGGHSSGNLINLAQTNGLAVVPAGQTHIPAGSPLQILQIGPLLS